MSAADILAAPRLVKRKRSSDAVSDTTHTTECTDVSHAAPVDPTAQQLAQQREQHAAARLKLEEQLLQLQEQKQHVAQQLEQLEGCAEDSKDAIGVSDLQAQLQEYAEQEQQASTQLAELGQQFEAAVADILGHEGRQQQQLEAAVKEQQQLQEAEVQQLAVEQQLAGSEFAVTDSSKHKAKKARLDRIESVWTWLQDSSTAAAAAEAEEPRSGPAQQQQQQDACEPQGRAQAQREGVPAQEHDTDPQCQQAHEQQQEQEQQEQGQEQQLSDEPDDQARPGL